MDETTEPVIAVLGHPIAGNPSQFALERALESLRDDGRVVSLEVAPERLAVALDGAEALGLRGVLLDAALAPAAGAWAEVRPGGLGGAGLPPAVDCLFRDPARNGEFVAADLARQWLTAAIDRHFRLRGRRIEAVVWIGPAPANGALPPADGVADAPLRQVTSAGQLTPDRLARADLVFLASGDAAEKRFAGRRAGERWPPDDASTLVVDLTDAGHPAAGRLGQLGYRVLTIEERRVAVLGESLQRWIGQTVSAEILRDAVEEYLAV